MGGPKDPEDVTTVIPPAINDSDTRIKTKLPKLDDDLGAIADDWGFAEPAREAEIGSTTPTKHPSDQPTAPPTKSDE